jgi:hypothetical protein
MSPINDTVGFNQTNTSSVYSDNYSKTTNGVSPQLILGGLILFIAILGCVANAAVLCVLIGSNKSLRGTVNFFVISQTFLDMLTCFLMSISTIAGFLRVSKSSRPMCILIGGGITTMLPLNASIMNMVIITLERYVKIVHPIYHRNHFRRWMTYAAVALCWIDGLSTCVISDFIVGTNCLSLPSSVGKVCFTKLYLNVSKVYHQRYTHVEYEYSQYPFRNNFMLGNFGSSFGYRRNSYANVLSATIETIFMY